MCVYPGYDGSHTTYIYVYVCMCVCVCVCTQVTTGRTQTYIYVYVCVCVCVCVCGVCVCAQVTTGQLSSKLGKNASNTDTSIRYIYQNYLQIELLKEFAIGFNHSL